MASLPKLRFVWREWTSNEYQDDMSTILKIFEFIIKIIMFSGSCVAIAYALFIFFGKKLIENHFSGKLEGYKHEMNQSLEKLKNDIYILSNRVKKIHEKEFEVLPEAWRKLQVALDYIYKFMASPNEVPDLDDMKEMEIKEYLSNSILSESEMKILISHPCKVEYYTERLLWYDLHDAKDALSDFRNYVVMNKIFLSSQLQKEFEHIGDVIQKILLVRKMYVPSENCNLNQSEYEKIKDNLNQLRDKIEQLVKERLRFPDA